MITGRCRCEYFNTMMPCEMECKQCAYLNGNQRKLAVRKQRNIRSWYFRILWLLHVAILPIFDSKRKIMVSIGNHGHTYIFYVRAKEA